MQSFGRAPHVLELGNDFEVLEIAQIQDVSPRDVEGAPLGTLRQRLTIHAVERIEEGLDIVRQMPTELRALMEVVNAEMVRRMQVVTEAIQSVRNALH